MRSHASNNFIRLFNSPPLLPTHRAEPVAETSHPCVLVNRASLPQATISAGSERPLPDTETPLQAELKGNVFLQMPIPRFARCICSRGSAPFSRALLHFALSIELECLGVLLVHDETTPNLVTIPVPLLTA